MVQFLIFLLWLAPTIRYRFDLGAVSFSLMEPLSFIVILVLLSLSLKFRINSKIKMDNATQMMFIFVIWVSLIRVFGKDWQHGLSDIRDWMIPLLIYTCLLSIFRTGWYKRTLMFVLIGVIHSALGIYQHVLDIFRPFATESSLYKTGFTPDSINVSPAFGFFEHPNSLATYLLIALLVGYAWLQIRGSRPLKLTLLLIIGLAFYWTFAKAQMLTMAYIIVLLFLIRLTKSPVIFVLLSVTLLASGLMAGWWFMNIYPELFGTFWWRVDLWKSVFQTIAEQPTILLIGNGDPLFAQNAIWPQPHNLYLHTILLYGLPGLFLILAIFFFLIRYGLMDLKRGWFLRHPILGTIWLAMLSSLVIGIVESSFIGIETRTIFLLIAASFMGLRREIAELNLASQSVIEPPVHSAKASLHNTEQTIGN